MYKTGYKLYLIIQSSLKFHSIWYNELSLHMKHTQTHENIKFYMLFEGSNFHQKDLYIVNATLFYLKF